MVIVQALYAVTRVGVTVGSRLIGTVVVRGAYNIRASVSAHAAVFFLPAMSVVQTLHAGEVIEPAIWIRIDAMGIVITLYTCLRRWLAYLGARAMVIRYTRETLAKVRITVGFCLVRTVSVG